MVRYFTILLAGFCISVQSYAQTPHLNSNSFVLVDPGSGFTLTINPGTLTLNQILSFPNVSGTLMTNPNNGTFPNQTGNGGKFLTTDGSVLSWATASGGLVNFTESLTTTAPYSTTDAAVRLLATNATATDIAVVLQPKGAGGLQAQLADNTATGGNKRGQYAVDWQMIRTSSTQVASGNSATVGGGFGNTASFSYATVSGGITNTASGSVATVGGGDGNTASGGYATVGGGIGSTASGSYATVGGGVSNTASGTNATVGGGISNTANALYSFIPGGTYALASNYGQMAQAAGAFAAQGDAQTSIFVLRNQTTNAAATSLFLNGNTLRIAIPTNGAMTFKVTIIGKETGGALGNGNVGGWEIIGTIANNGGAALIIGTNTTRVNNAPATWGAAPTVGVNGANMDIQVTGKAATNIDWVARVETVEVVF